MSPSGRSSQYEMSVVLPVIFILAGTAAADSLFHVSPVKYMWTNALDPLLNLGIKTVPVPVSTPAPPSVPIGARTPGATSSPTPSAPQTSPTPPTPSSCTSTAIVALNITRGVYLNASRSDTSVLLDVIRGDNVEPSFRLVGNTDSSGLVRNITQVQAESQPGETPVYYETINFPAFPAFPAYQPSGIYYGGLSTEQLYGNSQFAYINNYTLSQYAIAVSPASMNGTDINVQYQFVSMASGVAQNVTFITKVASSALNSFC